MDGHSCSGHRAAMTGGFDFQHAPSYLCCVNLCGNQSYKTHRFWATGLWQTDRRTDGRVDTQFRLTLPLTSAARDVKTLVTYVSSIRFLNCVNSPADRRPSLLWSKRLTKWIARSSGNLSSFFRIAVASAKLMYCPLHANHIQHCTRRLSFNTGLDGGY